MSVASMFSRLFGRKTTSVAAVPRPTPAPARPTSKSRLKKGSAVAAAAIALVGAWEGLRLVAYIPIPGDVPTVCFGETRGVELGDRYTRAECETMLVEGLEQFETSMRKCLTAPDAIPDNAYVAFLSLSYNIGTGAFCKSTLVRKANAGDIRGACNELTKWNRASGRVVAGLTNRRRDEKALCLRGLPA